MVYLYPYKSNPLVKIPIHNSFEPLMTKVIRFLGTPYQCIDIYQAIPVVPTVLTYVRLITALILHLIY